jgi:hypothetical protein
MDSVVYTKPGIIVETDASAVEQLWDDGSPVKYSIPANTLRAGSIIKARAWGVFDAAAADAWRIRIRIGTNAQMTAAPPTGTQVATHFGENANADQNWEIVTEILVKAIGASGDVMFRGNGASTRSDFSVSTGPSIYVLSDLALPTNGALEIAPTFDFGAAAAGNELELYGFTVEVQ